MFEIETRWMAEYKNVPNKRCMQAVVAVDGAGKEFLPRCTRNRIREAGLSVGRPVSLTDLARYLGITYQGLNYKVRGLRAWKPEEKAKVNEYIGVKVL